jgi:tRNA G10  N-methylase Trm11
MSYQYALEDNNYENFSSGRVLYNQQGATSFPVRHSCEIFLRCKHILEGLGSVGPYVIFDPLCGGAYTLTVLGFLYYKEIKKLYAADIDEKMILLAKRNLSLLTEEGMMKRISQLDAYYKEFGKVSHRDAITSAHDLKEIIRHRQQNIETFTEQSNALSPNYSNFSDKIDIIITDIPYGDIVEWSNTREAGNEIQIFLKELLPILNNPSVVAVTARKGIKISSEYYTRIDRFQIGKRQTVLLQPKEAK